MTVTVDHIETSAFRSACGQFATGVTVITVRDGDRMRGMTANSFTSVSLDPPLVAVCIDRRNRTHQLLSVDAPLVINVLAHSQSELATRFACSTDARRTEFSDVPHSLTESGLPLLTGAMAHFTCRVVAVHPAGDHSLFLAEVEELRHSHAAPLVFFSGKYQHIDLPEAAQATS